MAAAIFQHPISVQVVTRQTLVVSGIMRIVTARHPLSLGLVLTLALTACSSHLTSSSGANLPPTALAAAPPGPTDTDETLQQLIKNLALDDLQSRTEAENKLIHLAQASPPGREQVIQALIQAVQANDEFNGTHLVFRSTASYHFWRSATYIFLHLKATEAIPVMAQCIYCGNGLSDDSFFYEYQPAMSVLIVMGRTAVSGLAEVLQNSTNSIQRYYIELCLCRINQPEARQVLSRALPQEKREVRKTIRLCLEDMKLISASARARARGMPRRR